MVEEKHVSIRCDDRAENAVFSKLKWSNDDIWYEINIEDSYCRGDGHTDIGRRIARAWHALTDRPIYYSGITCSDKEKMRSFLNDCINIVEED